MQTGAPEGFLLRRTYCSLSTPQRRPCWRTDKTGALQFSSGVPDVPKQFPHLHALAKMQDGCGHVVFSRSCCYPTCTLPGRCATPAVRRPHRDVEWASRMFHPGRSSCSSPARGRCLGRRLRTHNTSLGFSNATRSTEAARRLRALRRFGEEKACARSCGVDRLPSLARGRGGPICGEPASRA